MQIRGAGSSGSNYTETLQMGGIGAADFMGRLVMASLGSIVLLVVLFLLGINISGPEEGAKQTS